MNNYDIFELKTDLADENSELFSQSSAESADDSGIFTSRKTENGIDIFTLEIRTKAAERQTGRKIGRYVTANVGCTSVLDNASFEALSETLSRVISQFTDCFPKHSSRFLLAGLGNPKLAADSVGYQTINNCIVTRHIKTQDPALFERLDFAETLAVVPDVFGNTGVESAEVLKGVANDIKPSCIIAIDALASRHLSKIARAVQICNTGICPGSGVGNSRAEISPETMRVPVIAIGVPTVVNASTLISDVLDDCGISKESLGNATKSRLSQRINEDCYVCPKDCGQSIKSISRLIGYSINRALHGNIEFSEMRDFL